MILIICILLSLMYKGCCSDNISPCYSQFSDKCTCGFMNYYGREMYVTNCTNTGMKDTQLLKYLPPETEVLIFIGNNVSALPINIFGTTQNYTNLKVIDFSNNNIQEIKGKTFHRVSTVERLILNHNSIMLSSQHPRIFSNFESLIELHLTNAFLDNSADDLESELHNVFINSSLTQLIKLHLEQNEITQFKDKRIFCDLPNLMDLHLGNNRLTRFDFDIKCLKHLRYIDLESNRISYLSDEALNTFDLLPSRNQQFSIDINNNPFPCNCDTLNLYNWVFVSKNNVTVKDKESLRCTYSNGFANISDLLSNLKTNECYLKHQDVSQVDVRSYNVFINYFLIIFIFILIAFLTYIIYKQTSEHCKRNNILANKIHYTIIGKAEEQEAHV